MKKYDYLIVGAGLFGSVFAHEMTKRGKSCLVIDKRDHIGGNIYCEKMEDINVHKYGAHIFHTDNKRVWDYVNQFTEFNHYINSPIANYNGEIYNLPFNMNTFHTMWGVISPQEAYEKINQQINQYGVKNPSNLEEQAISLVGKDIYEKLIKGYTQKQWGRKATDLPAFIIKRLPIRFTYDNNYFNDRYQGIPIGGYNGIIDKLLKSSDVKLSVDYFSKKDEFNHMANYVLFTGMIDEFYNYKFGNLQYRSLTFEHEIINLANYQGNAVVNYTDENTAFIRIIEHKHFEFGNQDKTVITREYPSEWHIGDEPYYPINDDRNMKVFAQYKKLASSEKNVLFGGRLADYKYYDMDDVIERAIELAESI